MKKIINEIMRPQNLLTIICGFIALATGLYAIIVIPPSRDVSSLGVFLFKLLPFIFGAITISLFKKEYCAYLIKTKIAIPMFIIAFLIYFGAIVPMVFFVMSSYGDGAITFREAFDGVYYLRLMEVPYIILVMTFVFRIAGGSTSNTLKLSFSLLAVMLSGIEDLAFFVVNGLPIPDEWTWVTHMQVRIGRFPTKYEAYVFITAHLILAAAIIFAPWEKLKVFKWLSSKINDER